MEVFKLVRILTLRLHSNQNSYVAYSRNQGITKAAKNQLQVDFNSNEFFIFLVDQVK